MMRRILNMGLVFTIIVGSRSFQWGGGSDTPVHIAVPVAIGTALVAGVVYLWNRLTKR